MIHEVSGDILFTGAEAIAHGVAANDPMTQGLALALHTRLPTMHKDFHHWCHQQRPVPGEVFLWRGPDIVVINLLTQDGGYGHGARPGKASVHNVSLALRALAKLVREAKLKSLAIPRIATGVGGLTWDLVHPLIEERLSELKIPIYLYADYQADKRASEPRK